MSQKIKKVFKYIYPATDFILSFVILMACFLSSKTEDTIMLNCLIFSLIASALIVVFFTIVGVYRVEITEIGFSDTSRIALFSIIYAIICFTVAGFIPGLPNHGDSIFPFILAFIAGATVLGTTRYIPRMINNGIVGKLSKNRYKTIVIGAGGAAKIIIEDAHRNPESKNRIVAIVDDDPEKIGKTYSGLKIEGPIKNIKQIVEKYNAEEIIIAIANLEKNRLHEIIELISSETNVRVKRMPLLNEMDGPYTARIMNVDLVELLERDPIILDNSEMHSMLKGKTVLVTGAGGSIGSELVRQIYCAHPANLILFDIYENATYDIQMELLRKKHKENITDVKIIALIGSTYNETRVEQIIKKYRPDYIYHAAAYKHVPLMEDSPMEAIRTNVIGTYNVAKMADKYGVKKMLLVSTDKAVRPTNVMGATKRFAETIIQYFASISKHTYYCAVRFGNVLGSNGSVIPLFKKQIAEGGPVTVTDKRINRFFKTIPEAVGLILQSSLFATGGEIFILDMGKPVKIINLAERMIRQAGYIPYYDIEIKFTGLRPGEKLYEEILLDVSEHKKTSNSKIYIEEKQAVYPVDKEIIEIQKVFDMEENEEIKNELRKIITTYTSPEEVNDKK